MVTGYWCKYDNPNIYFPKEFIEEKRHQMGYPIDDDIIDRLTSRQPFHPCHGCLFPATFQSYLVAWLSLSDLPSLPFSEEVRRGLEKGMEDGGGREVCGSVSVEVREYLSELEEGGEKKGKTKKKEKRKRRDDEVEQEEKGKEQEEEKEIEKEQEQEQEKEEEKEEEKEKEKAMNNDKQSLSGEQEEQQPPQIPQTYNTPTEDCNITPQPLDTPKKYRDTQGLQNTKCVKNNHKFLGSRPLRFCPEKKSPYLEILGELGVMGEEEEEGGEGGEGKALRVLGRGRGWKLGLLDVLVGCGEGVFLEVVVGEVNQEMALGVCDPDKFDPEVWCVWWWCTCVCVVI